MRIGPFTVEVSETLKIKNPNATPVAFKVKTTAPKQYVWPHTPFICQKENRMLTRGLCSLFQVLRPSKFWAHRTEP